MSSSLSLWPHTGNECGSKPKCSQGGICNGHLLPHRHRSTGASRNKVQCSARTRGTCSIIRSVASDVAKLNHKANHIKVNNLDNSTNGALMSTTDAPVSPADTSLLRPHHHTQDAHKEIPVDILGRGGFVENKQVYRQTFVIRSYEVGFDKTAPIETMTNLFQETSLNHVGMMDFVGDGMGTTHAMIRNRLIWVVTKMHIEMMQYPAWGDVVQIDSWVSSSGKNGMRRDFLVRDYCTGLTLGRATSNWAMMNQDTRRLSKMPEEVMVEISPCFLERSVMDKKDDAFKRIPLLDDSAPFRITGLAPKVHDLDMNQHVNHVKYIDWMLESVPQSMLMSCELRRVTLEYRRECGSSDTLESLAQSDMALDYDDAVWKEEGGCYSFTHLLRLCDTGTEVLRGRTQWTPKGQNHQN